MTRDWGRINMWSERLHWQKLCDDYDRAEVVDWGCRMQVNTVRG